MSSSYRETSETSSCSSDTDSSVSSDEVDQHDENLRLEGLTLRNYNIITEIGRGGYAIVWLAYNVQNGKFSAIKIQNHMDYKDGLDELKILKQLPHNLNYFNNLLDYFIEKRKVDKKTRKYLCMVFELCTSNLDTIIRKGEFKEGLQTFKIVRKLDPLFPIFVLLGEARAYLTLGKFEKAFKLSEEALDRNPRSARAMLSYISASWKLGNKEDAKWKMEEFLLTDERFNLDQIDFDVLINSFPWHQSYKELVKSVHFEIMQDQ